MDNEDEPISQPTLLPTVLDGGIRAPSAEMIFQLAVGRVETATIAAAYGYSVDDWKFLQDSEPLKRAVALKRIELEANGFNTKSKASMMAHDSLDDLYLILKNPETSNAIKLEISKFLAKIGDLEPKALAATAAQGAGFRININFPTDSRRAPPVIDVTPEPDTPAVIGTDNPFSVSADLAALDDNS